MDAAKQLFETIKKRGITLINDWVNDGCREDLHLDFKRKSRASRPKLMDDDRKIILKHCLVLPIVTAALLFEGSVLQVLDQTREQNILLAM